DVSRSARIGRNQFAGQIQLFNQVEELMRAAQAVRPALDQKAFDFAALNHASRTVAAFDEQQIATHLLQTMSRDQTGNARAYDDRINIHLVCSVGPLRNRVSQSTLPVNCITTKSVRIQRTVIASPVKRSKKNV